MRKFFVLVAFLFCFDFLYADFFSIRAGAGYERQNISGYVKLGDVTNYFNNSLAQSDGNCNTGDFGLKNTNNPYFWVKFIHPIPILPNIKFEYTKYESDGHSKYIAGNVKIFNDVNIPSALTNAYTKMNIDSYDVTLFYEFKPILADIEAGFGVDYWRGKTKISGENAACVNGNIVLIGGDTNIDKSWSVILPYLYGSLETIKFFGVSALGYVKWAKAGDNHHYEYLGALKYTFDIVGAINPFVKIGYKYKDVFGVDGDNQTKLQYKGIFMEIGAEF